MGSTFVGFRGSGYEASDGTLEVWLHLLVSEIDTRERIDAWLREVREEWELQSTAGFGFGVMPGLDRFVTNEDQRELLLSLSERALHALQQKGEVISKGELNLMHLGGQGSSYLDDVPTEAFMRVGRYFIKLLRGELSPEENDARMWR